MTSGHIFFIPGVLMVGMFLGFILGARAARNQFDLQQRRDAERDAAKAARAAKKADAAMQSDPLRAPLTSRSSASAAAMSVRAAAMRR